MNKKLLTLSFCAVLSLFANASDLMLTFADNLYGTWQYVDFDESMQLDVFPNAISKTSHMFNADGQELWNFFKDLYEKNSFLHCSPQKEPRIPKIIHHIWLGGPVPEVLKKYIQSFHDMHPDWEFKLWLDEDVENLGLYNQELFDAADNYGCKADIARYEILYRFGGVYADTDMECLQPLDIFHHTYDFYSGLQPLDTYFLQLGIGIVGTTPQHPILDRCIKMMRESFYETDSIPIKTGPILFSRACLLEAGRAGTIDIIFPASYFYPFGAFGDRKSVDRDAWIDQGAFAVHWWGKTWMDYRYRTKEFKQIRNMDDGKQRPVHCAAHSKLYKDTQNTKNKYADFLKKIVEGEH